MRLNSFINNHLLNRSIVSYILYPFSLLFGVILLFRRKIYNSIIKPYQAPVVIISIGNIIAGGSGKTPFTIYLAHLLLNHNLKIGISHRGYKSDLESKTILISNATGLLAAAENAGDEAWLLAKRLHSIPVVVGKNRKKAIQLLMKQFPDVQCIILDDSFQHLKVKHNLDFIIVNDKLGFGNGFVLPAGYLREPVSVLKYADAFVYNQTNEVTQITKINNLKSYNKPIFSGLYHIDCIYTFDNVIVETSSLIDKKIMLLSGIGNPQSFEESCKALSIKILKHTILSDHCDYANSEFRKGILDDFAQSGATHILTTEKDYAKLRKYSEFSDCLLILAIRFELKNDTESLIELVSQVIKVV